MGVAALGVAFGCSQAVYGGYDESTWAPAGLAVLVLLLASTVAAPRRSAFAAALPLLGLALWSLVSSSWAESADAARIAADRWLVYGAALAVLVQCVAGRRGRAQTLLAAAAAGVLAVGALMLLQMLRHHGASLFLGNRLNDPLGYVNGEAGYLLAGVWPCCALAERRRQPAFAGLGLGGLVVLVGLGALTRSRSWELGLIGSTLLVVVAIPGRWWRIAVLLVAGIAIFAIHAPLAEVSHQAAATDVATQHAAVAILLAAAAASAVWAVAVWVLGRCAPPGTHRHAAAKRLARAALAVAVAAAVAVNGAHIASTVRAQYRAFVHLAPNPGTGRLLSGGGNRSDYWRVAWLEFRSEPVRGIGAGNFDPGYYQHRRTTEAITQPHSLELQTLAELGLVGLALLAGFLVVVARVVLRAARLARGDPASRCVAVAGTGLFAGWLAQTSADWEHLIPGLTLIALAAVAALVAVGEKPVSFETEAPPYALTRRPHAYLIGASAVLACAGAILIGPRVLSLRAQASAQSALDRDDPRAAIVDSSQAFEYDGTSVSALVVRAAAFARVNAFALARNDLRHALEVEPQNWVTWALMGDLLSRHGNLLAARSAYRRALALDPLETTLTTALATRRTVASK